MKKQKLSINKETLKTLTLSAEDLAQVVGGQLDFPRTTTTGATCRSCDGSCVTCPRGDIAGTIYINPSPEVIRGR